MKVWYLLHFFIFRKFIKYGICYKNIETTAFIIQQNQRMEGKDHNKIYVLKFRMCLLKIAFGENLYTLFIKNKLL